jgi:chaperonin GroEL
MDDALYATLSAMEEGIIAGGGFTYIDSIKKIDMSGVSQDVISGMRVVAEALESPLRKICENAGVSPDYIVEKIKETGLGYNAKTKEFTDLIKDGVIDPAKVGRVALENAASVASLILTTACAIVEDVRDDI